jgi:hypothetical protein
MVETLVTLPANVAGMGEGCEDAHIDAECSRETLGCVKCL